MIRLRVGQFEVRILEGTFLQNVQTGCGAHTAYCSVGTDVLSSGVKRPGHEAYHFPSYSAEIKNEWSYTPIPLYAFTVRRATTLTSIYVHVSRPASIFHFLTFLPSSSLLCFFLYFLLSFFNLFFCPYLANV